MWLHAILAAVVVGAIPFNAVKFANNSSIALSISPKTVPIGQNDVVQLSAVPTPPSEEHISLVLVQAPVTQLELASDEYLITTPSAPVTETIVAVLDTSSSVDNHISPVQISKSLADGEVLFEVIEDEARRSEDDISVNVPATDSAAVAEPFEEVVTTEPSVTPCTTTSSLESSEDDDNEHEVEHEVASEPLDLAAIESEEEIIEMLLTLLYVMPSIAEETEREEDNSLYYDFVSALQCVFRDCRRALRYSQFKGKIMVEPKFGRFVRNSNFVC